MNHHHPSYDAKVSQGSDMKEPLTSPLAASGDERGRIDPLVDEWLLQLVKIAIAIAAREKGCQEDSDAS